jgi:hypothetical protein
MKKSDFLVTVLSHVDTLREHISTDFLLSVIETSMHSDTGGKIFCSDERGGQGAPIEYKSSGILLMHPADATSPSTASRALYAAVYRGVCYSLEHNFTSVVISTTVQRQLSIETIVHSISVGLKEVYDRVAQKKSRNPLKLFILVEPTVVEALRQSVIDWATALQPLEIDH